jgi:phage terminase small subunit
MPATGAKGMTPMQRKFAHAYASSLNLTKASKEAGYADVGAGWRLMNDKAFKHVQELVAELKAEQFQRLHMTGDEILAGLANVARVNLGDIIETTPDGDPFINLANASPQFMSALVSAEVEDFMDSRERDAAGEVVAREVRRVKVRTHDKVRALELLAKHAGLLKDKLEVSADDSFAVLLMKAANLRKDNGQ